MVGIQQLLLQEQLNVFPGNAKMVIPGKPQDIVEKIGDALHVQNQVLIQIKMATFIS